MKNFSALLGLCYGLLSLSAWAQPGYLVKIDGVNQAAVDQIRNSGIEVYAKTAGFWVAGVGKEDLRLLTRQRITFQILDHEEGTGDYYLISVEPPGKISLQVEEIKAKSQLLFAEQGRRRLNLANLSMGGSSLKS